MAKYKRHSEQFRHLEERYSNLHRKRPGRKPRARQPLRPEQIIKAIYSRASSGETSTSSDTQGAA